MKPKWFNSHYIPACIQLDHDWNSTINVQGAYVLSFCYLHKEFRSPDTCSYIIFTYVQGVYINATCADDGTVHVLDS